MKIVVSFIFGMAAAVSLSSIAQTVSPSQGNSLAIPVEGFMNAGGKDEDGVGRRLRMTKDGRVLAKCD